MSKKPHASRASSMWKNNCKNKSENITYYCKKRLTKNIMLLYENKNNMLPNNVDGNRIDVCTYQSL